MENYINNMQSIVHQLISISKGNFSFFPINVDIHKFIISQCQLFKSGRSDLKINIINTFNSLLYVSIDTNLFSQLFLNLFINSYHAMESKTNKQIDIIIKYLFNQCIE